MVKNMLLSDKIIYTLVQFHKQSMSVVPRTKTHAVNLPNLTGAKDTEAITLADLWDVYEPVQVIRNRNGQNDPNLFSYFGPILDLNAMIEMARHNRGQLMNPYDGNKAIGYEDLDVVRWTNLPASITSSPQDYVQRTERHLAQLRSAPRRDEIPPPLPMPPVGHELHDFMQEGARIRAMLHEARQNEEQIADAQRFAAAQRRVRMLGVLNGLFPGRDMTHLNDVELRQAIGDYFIAMANAQGPGRARAA